MGKEYAINRSTIDVLRQLSERLVITENELKAASDKMERRFGEEEPALGNLHEQAYNMCQKARQCNSHFSDAVIPIGMKLNQIADQVDRLLSHYESDGYSGNENGRPSEFSEVKLGVYKRLPPIMGYENLSEVYMEQLMLRYKDADPLCRKVFKKYKDMCLVQDTEYELCPHYEHKEEATKGIYYNSTNDMINPKGTGTTFYHEVGHMMDHAMGGFQGYLSDDIFFEAALHQDGESMVNRWESMNDEQKSKFKRLMFEDQYHSVADLLYPLTNGLIHGKWGHDEAYWEADRSRAQKEAFAHFFEANMGDEKKRKVLEKVFPNAYSEFKKLLTLQIGE